MPQHAKFSAAFRLWHASSCNPVTTPAATSHASASPYTRAQALMAITSDEIREFCTKHDLESRLSVAVSDALRAESDPMAALIASLRGALDSDVVIQSLQAVQLSDVSGYLRLKSRGGSFTFQLCSPSAGAASFTQAIIDLNGDAGHALVRAVNAGGCSAADDELEARIPASVSLPISVALWEAYCADKAMTVQAAAQRAVGLISGKRTPSEPGQVAHPVALGGAAAQSPAGASAQGIFITFMTAVNAGARMAALSAARAAAAGAAALPVPGQPGVPILLADWAPATQAESASAAPSSAGMGSAQFEAALSEAPTALASVARALLAASAAAAQALSARGVPSHAASMVLHLAGEASAMSAEQLAEPLGVPAGKASKSKPKSKSAGKGGSRASGRGKNAAPAWEEPAVPDEAQQYEATQAAIDRKVQHPLAAAYQVHDRQLYTAAVLGSLLGALAVECAAGNVPLRGVVQPVAQDDADGWARVRRGIGHALHTAEAARSAESADAAESEGKAAAEGALELTVQLAGPAAVGKLIADVDLAHGWTSEAFTELLPTLAAYTVPAQLLSLHAMPTVQACAAAAADAQGAVVDISVAAVPGLGSAAAGLGAGMLLQSGASY